MQVLRVRCLDSSSLLYPGRDPNAQRGSLERKKFRGVNVCKNLIHVLWHIWMFRQCCKCCTLILGCYKILFFSVVVLQLNKSRNKSVPALDLQFALDQGQNFWWVSKG